MKKQDTTTSKTVAILHPDLGIGGAEQLILNVAKSFHQEQNINVTVYTSHYDTNHCLQESKHLKVSVKGTCCGLIPRSCCGKRFHAALSYLKMLLAALTIALFGGQFDVILLDQISFPIPFLRLLTSAQIVYYCHFPDKLLCVERSSVCKRLYRRVIDKFEEISTRFAHKVFVNSKFTQKVFYDTFRRLQGVKTQVLYPCIDFSQFQVDNDALITDICPQFRGKMIQNTILITSLNRYEYKKNIKLVLDIVKQLSNTKQFVQLLRSKRVHFCIAGGYDQRVQQNVSYFKQLQQYADSIFQQKINYITFMRSISNQQRKMLLKTSSILLYTPQNQHFGIVPLEAMFNGNIVFGCNSGGPTETIIDNKTGYLLDGGATQWADKLIQVIKLIQGEDKVASTEMRLTAFEHVRSNFSFDAFKKKLLESVFVDDFKIKRD